MQDRGSIIEYWLGKCATYSVYLGASMAGVSLLIVMLIISLNVCLRYFFNKPILVTYEYSTYLFIMIVYFGFAYTTRREAHINVDVVVKRLPKRVRVGLEVLTSLAALALMSIYLWFAWGIFRTSVVMGYRAMSVTQTPEWIPQSILVVGLAFLIIEIVALIARKSRDFQRG